MHRWAWEFLRRNPAFEAEMKEAKKAHTAMKERGKIRIGWNEWPTGAVLQKWGVESPTVAIRPDAEAPFWFEQFPQLLRSGAINGVRLQYAESRDDRLCLEFDLSSPIPPQIARAKRLLELNQEDRSKRGEIQEVRTRNNEAARMFPTYLRVLDAIAEGASEKEIGIVLQAGNENLRTWIAKAEELRDGGYKRLLQK